MANVDRLFKISIQGRNAGAGAGPYEIGDLSKGRLLEFGPSDSDAVQIVFGPFRLLPSERLLTKNGQPVEIGGRALDLLVALVENPGRVLTKRELLSRIWPDVLVEESSLRFQMAGLRQILGDGRKGARYIATQVGVGYAFVGPVEKHSIAKTERSLLPRDARLEEPKRSAGAIGDLPPRARVIGRDIDLELILDRLREPRLFTIVGAGGSGKTTLAVEVGHQLRSSEGRQVHFADLASVADASLVPSTLAGALGIEVQTDDPLAVLLAHIRTRELVLVIDNCEHLVDAVSAVAERIRDAALGVSILATSREPLRARNEHVHWLGPLGFPMEAANLTLEQLLAFPAIELFMERSLAGNAAFKADVEDVRLIAEICRRLDGMALPIELAAMRAATHGVQATFTQLGERFSLLWSGRRTALPRQQTLQATLDWSYDLLTPGERRTFERLSVFWGAFPADAACHVIVDAETDTMAAVSALDGLAAKGLIVLDRSEDRVAYRLLEMTRAFAKAKHQCRGPEEVDRTSRRHATFYLDALAQISSTPEHGFEGATRLSGQLGNVRSALDWSFGPGGDLAIGIPVAAASIPLLLSLSLLVECRSRCQQAIARLDDRHRGTADEMELQAALGLTLMFTRGNVEAVEVALRRGLEIAEVLADRWSQLRLLARLQIFFERIGDFSSSMKWAEQAVEVAKAIGQPEAIAVAASLSGLSHHLLGNQRLARRELEMSLSLGMPSRRSRTLYYGFDHRNRAGIALARTLWLQGYPDQARKQVAQTEAEAAALEHPVTYCIALLWAFGLHLAIGDAEKAVATLEAFSKCSELNAFGPYIAASRGFRGRLAIYEGRPHDAVDWIRESLASLQSDHYELLTTSFEIAMTDGLLQSGRPMEALALADTMIERCRRGGDGYFLPELLRRKARILTLCPGEEACQAEELLLEALACSRQQGAVAFELWCARDLARLWIERGRITDAFELLQPLHRDLSEGRDTKDVRDLEEIWRSVSSLRTLQKGD